MATPPRSGTALLTQKTSLARPWSVLLEFFGCLTCTEDGIYLTIVGEKEAIDKLEEVRLVALSDEYGYKYPLSRALSGADIGKDQFKKWQEDYIQGFFDGLIGNFDLGLSAAISKNPHVLGILDGADSMWRYVKDKENK